MLTAASHAEHHHTSLGVDSRKLGMWALIASECLLFGSLIATYLIYRSQSVAGPSPAQILDIPVTSVSTFVLLMSSFSIVLALHGIQSGDIAAFRRYILLTALGGTVFLGFQTYEFTHFVQSGLGFSTNVFGSSFFMLTGTHGTHVAVGVIWLLSLYFSSVRGKLTEDAAIKVDTMALYWHFVDVIWIVIFTVVYLFVFV
ncbi:MAG: cytochrome c oxidase subunit 3 [Candidatus Lambdaproteobacteria bacterium]|nr:cytochrome c oxidase subunit 3 [Candidatus Lambdaproteobacteria bacterium]